MWWVIINVLLIGAWMTHVIVTVANDAWLFMIAAALVFPVAIVHGISVWFGFNWLH